MSDDQKTGTPKPETAAEHTGSADVSYGLNSNLDPDLGAGQSVTDAQEQPHTDGPASDMDNSGMLKPQGDGHSEDTIGQSGDDRHRDG